MPWQGASFTGAGGETQTAPAGIQTTDWTPYHNQNKKNSATGSVL